MFLRERPDENRAVRLVGMAGLYTFAYVASGSVAWLFVRPYYDRPDSGLRLRAPKGWVVVSLQMLRGLLTTLALVPLAAAIRASGPDWWLRLSVLLAAVMGIAPLLMATRSPARLRIYHAIEISAFAVAYSFAVWLFIARRPAAV